MLASVRTYLPDPFILGLLGMILLARLVPGIGMGDFSPNLSTFIDIGISLIFFFYGLKLNPEKIRQGMSNWRMHLAVHTTTFLLFPLLVLPFYPFFHGTPYEIFWLGVFFLAALPSTVSSSVVMVSIAGGNIPGAIFNASISGIIGILATPLWMGIFLSGSSDNFQMNATILQLIIQIIAPVILGLLLHRFFAAWVNRNLRRLARFDKMIILLIVYEAFSKSFQSGIFNSISPLVFVWLVLSVVLLFFLIFFFTGKISAWLKFNSEDRITLQFTGSTKSLVHGSVFASLLFSGIHGAGVFLLPVMIYHAFQLFYISLAAGKMRRKQL